MSDDDDFEDELGELRNLSEKYQEQNSSCRFQVSGWEKDTDGIEEEPNPHGIIMSFTVNEFFSYFNRQHLSD